MTPLAHTSRLTVDRDFDPARSWPGLCRLLQQQMDLYQRLSALAGRQTALLDAQRHEDLPDVLQERRGVITQLQEVDQQLAPFRLHWIDWLPLLSPTDRAQANEMTQRLTQMRQEVQEQDQRIYTRLRQDRDRLAEEIARLQNNGTALRGYRKSPLGTPALARMDRQG